MVEVVKKILHMEGCYIYVRYRYYWWRPCCWRKCGDVFAAKAGKKTLVLDSNKSMTARALMWNHYAVDEITGPDMLEIGKKQAVKFGAEIKEETVSSIKGEAGNLKVETESGASYEAAHVIIATGALANLADAIGLETKEH